VTDDERPADDNTTAAGSRSREASSKGKDKSFIAWILYKPWTKRPVFYFLIIIVATIANAIFYFMDHDTAYIICGVVGISICVYGMRHFGKLMLLKTHIDSFGSLNVKFRREQFKLNREVDSIEAANRNLRDTHHRLVEATKRNRENLAVFRELEVNMSRLGKESIAGLSELQQKCKNMEKKWHDELYNHQRNLVHAVFERLEQQGMEQGQGITRRQFEQFQQELPDEYKARFARLGTFDAMSEGKEVIDAEDFKKALDVFAEMAADDVDIEFEVKKTPKVVPQDGSGEQLMYDREVVVTRRTERSLRYQDIGTSLFDLDHDSAEHHDMLSDDEHEAAAHSMFGSRQKPEADKQQTAKFKSMARKKFADLLDSVD